MTGRVQPVTALRFFFFTLRPKLNTAHQLTVSSGLFVMFSQAEQN